MGYVGPVFSTAKGKLCQKWHLHDSDLGFTDNYCRNPEPGLKSNPWCYTRDGEREDCDIQRCSKLNCFAFCMCYFLLLTGSYYSFGFLHMVDYSISSLKTFYICQDRRFVTIPANIKKSYNKLCYKQIKIYCIFISIKKFHKA